MDNRVVKQKTFKISLEYEERAKKHKLNMNSYVAYLVRLSENNMTKQQEMDHSNIKELRTIVENLQQQITRLRADRMEDLSQMRNITKLNEALMLKLDTQIELIGTIFAEVLK